MLSTDCLELPRLSSVRLSSRETSDSLPCRPKVLLRSLLWGCVSLRFASAWSRRAHSLATRGSTPPAEVWPRASNASTCNLKPASMDRGASPPNVISCCIVETYFVGPARASTARRARVCTYCRPDARAHGFCGRAALRRRGSSRRPSRPTAAGGGAEAAPTGGCSLRNASGARVCRGSAKSGSSESPGRHGVAVAFRPHARSSEAPRCSSPLPGS